MKTQVGYSFLPILLQLGLTQSGMVDEQAEKR